MISKKRQVINTMKNKLIIISMMGLLNLFGCSVIHNKTPVETYFDEITDIYDLPDEPGEEGLTTLVGVDSNENGVRDDVEREIYLLIDVARQYDYYPDLASFELALARKLEVILVSENPIVSNQEALMSIRGLQKYVSDTNTILRAEEKLVPPISLIHEKEVMYIANIIRGLVYNTPERQKRLENQMYRVKIMLSGK